MNDNTNGHDAMKNLDNHTLRTRFPECRFDSKFVDRLHQHAQLVAENVAQAFAPAEGSKV